MLRCRWKVTIVVYEKLHQFDHSRLFQSQLLNLNTLGDETPAVDAVIKAAELQDFDGFWNLDKNLANLFNVKLSKLPMPPLGELSQFVIITSTKKLIW